MISKLIVRNLQGFQKDLEKEDKNRIKSAETATKVEGYRLMKELKNEIKQGAPGGRPFSPLTEMARRTGKKINRKPLAKMAVPVRYQATKEAGHFQVSLGYLTEGTRKVSKRWRSLVELHQEGGTIRVTEELRKGLMRIGARLKKRKVPEAKYFFLRAGTTALKTPARDIIDPFWAAHKAEASRNIDRNFERKLKGERI